MSEAITMQEVLTEMRGAVTSLQSAEQTVVEAKNELLGAPVIANDAKAIAQQAKTTADAAATKTEVAAIKTTADNALPKTTASSTYATKTEMNAVKTTADAAATKTEVAAVKQTADAALPKSGGEMSGPVYLESNFDQATIPDSLKISLSPILFRDVNKVRTGSLETRQLVAGDVQIQVSSARKVNGTDVYSSILAGVSPDGTAYATAPHPRGLYNADIATMKSVMDFSPKKVSNQIVNIGGANVSDTADLWNGRGDVDKPFASLQAAANWAARNLFCPDGVITLALNADITLDSPLVLRATGINELRIASAGDTPHTLTLGASGYLGIYGGNITVRNLNIVVNGSPHIFYMDGRTARCNLMLYGGIILSGSVTTAVMSIGDGCQCVVREMPAGEITGRKYILNNGGYICLPSGATEADLPGTTAGAKNTNIIAA